MARDQDSKKSKARNFHAQHAQRRAENFVPRPTQAKLVHTPGMCANQRAIIQAWDECAQPKDTLTLVQVVQGIDPSLKSDKIKKAANELLQGSHLQRVTEGDQKLYALSKKGREARAELGG